MKKVCLLGATGSIGQQVLDIIRSNQELKLEAFSFYNNIELALKIITEFKPNLVASPNKKYDQLIKAKAPNIILSDDLCDVVRIKEDNIIVINALVGSSGLKPSYVCLDEGHDLLLANKESLVVAGEILVKKAAEKKVKIIPIDSEHCAILQLIDNHESKNIDYLILTASGGALYNIKKEDLSKVTVDDALKHPSWSMGSKITIDSATMMNKGFEVIEACYLFNVCPEKIKIIIHPESIIHSMVAFKDKSIHAQLAVSDMRIPISYAINYPNYIDNLISKDLNLEQIGQLNFYAFDEKRFSLVQTAIEAYNKKGFYPCVLNASNEIAVQMFLDGKISFDQIENIIKETLKQTEKLTDGLDLNIDNLMFVTNKVKNMLNREVL